MTRVVGSKEPLETSSPEEENSFHTPQHSQGNRGSVWNFVASQDSIDVFHDAHSVLQATKLTLSSPRKRHASSGPKFEPIPDTHSTIGKGPLARVRHFSHGSKSCNTSPLHTIRFTTQSLRRPKTVPETRIPVEESHATPPMAELKHSASTQTNDWMKNYVPCVGLEAFLYSDSIKREDLEHTALLHNSQKLASSEHYSLKKIKRRHGCLYRIRDEFRLVNFKLHHKSPHLFVTSQWQQPNDMSCMYLAYRLFWGVYFCLWSVWSCAGFRSYDAPPEHKKFYLLYLTNWCMWLLALDTMLQAVNVIMHMKKIAEDGDARYTRMKTSFDASWVLSNITTSLHTFITVIFYTMIAHTHQGEFNAQNLDASLLYSFSVIGVHTHIVPSVYVTLDLLVSAMPRRILHFYMPMLFLTIYGIFTDIYYLTGGEDPFGSRSIYPILDWGKPAETLLIASGLVLVVIPLLHCVFACGLYALRIKLWTRIRGSSNLTRHNSVEELMHHSISREEKV